MESNPQHLRRTIRTEQLGAIDLAGQEAARLAMPLSRMEILKGLSPVEDQFRTAIRYNTLRRRIFAIVFQKPKPVDKQPKPRRWRDFTISEHLSIIADAPALGFML
jgi:hypothetical protein